MSERIAAGCNRPVQKAAVRVDGWTEERRQIFLDTLAHTCNVRMSIAAAGMGFSSAYQLRRRDPAFAELWREALTIGYDRLEEALLQHALEGVNAIEIHVDGPATLGAAEVEVEVEVAGDGAVAVAGEGAGAGDDAREGAAPFRPGSGAKPGAADVQLALLLLNRHRAAVAGHGGSGARKRASSAATDAALREKLDRLARQLRDER